MTAAPRHLFSRVARWLTSSDGALDGNGRYYSYFQHISDEEWMQLGRDIASNNHLETMHLLHLSIFYATVHARSLWHLSLQ